MISSSQSAHQRGTNRSLATRAVSPSTLPRIMQATRCHHAHDPLLESSDSHRMDEGEHVACPGSWSGLIARACSLSMPAFPFQTSESRVRLEKVKATFRSAQCAVRSPQSAVRCSLFPSPEHSVPALESEEFCTHSLTPPSLTPLHLCLPLPPSPSSSSSSSSRHATPLPSSTTTSSTLLGLRPTMDRSQIFSRRTIEGLIAAGHTILITEGRVLQLDGWLDKHPGGRLAVLHMVGRDATDEINV